MIFIRLVTLLLLCFSFFFFNDTATTEIYTLSLHDALPISHRPPHHLDPVDVIGREIAEVVGPAGCVLGHSVDQHLDVVGDRKSTRLNSSHSQISYAVFCLKKKTKNQIVAS